MFNKKTKGVILSFYLDKDTKTGVREVVFSWYTKIPNREGATVHSIGLPNDFSSYDYHEAWIERKGSIFLLEIGEKIVTRRL